MGFRKDQIGEGFVYVIRSTNPANFNEIKVGLSKDSEVRRISLSGTGSPLPFAFERVWAVTNMAFAESIAHDVLKEHTMNTEREFFYIVPLHMHEGVFGNLYYEPTEEEIDGCLNILLERIENSFMLHVGTLNAYTVDPTLLPAYSRALRRGPVPPERLF